MKESLELEEEAQFLRESEDDDDDERDRDGQNRDNGENPNRVFFFMTIQNFRENRRERMRSWFGFRQ